MSGRILFISTGLGAGGAETLLLKLAKQLKEIGTHCGVVSLGDEGVIGPALRCIGIPVWCLRLSRPLAWPSALSKLRNALSTFRPTVVQGWMYHGNIVATWAAHMSHPSRALAWSVRQSLATPSVDHFTTRLAIRLSAFLSQKADVIIYNSSAARESHEARSFSASKGTVLPNGFDIRSSAPGAESSQEVRDELHVPPHASLIGHVARWHPVKDHRTLLAALARVTRRYDQTVCALVGDGVDANNRELSDTVHAFGLQRNVRLLGRRTDIARLQAAFDIACLSSRAESFPNAIGEAMCAGVPCVSTAVGDVAKMIADTGHIVPVGDADAFADALLDLISIGPKRLKDLGARARRRIVENYSIESVAAQYASLYDTIAAKRPGQVS